LKSSGSSHWKGNAGCDLQVGIGEFLARSYALIVRVADQIRTAVLAEAEMDPGHAPLTTERLRNVVSVRKLRARLGAGDPTTLSRAVNAIETEVVRASLALVVILGLPDTIAEQMQALWHAAVAVLLDEVGQMIR
jgi:alkanesulfonate monooxygenase SsuD/methylene tetrahydromethanopterin reductase-like flavin-dependent oxidoreductase (luciferase family)